jgi:DNA-directed RNA polymerase specialized sigma24 family protein
VSPARDPRPKAMQRVILARATVLRCDDAADKARAALRRAEAQAVAVGVSKAEIGRAIGTSESRVRQDVIRYRAEAR